MYEREIAIFLISTTLVLIILIVSIFYVVNSYRKRRQSHIFEKQKMKEEFEKDSLLAETETQQSLMKQIGEELHDTVGQRLTLAYLQVQNLKREIKEEKIIRHLNDHGNIIQSSLQDIRNLSKLLNNEMLENYGFGEAVRQELIRIKEADICNTHFSQTGERYIFPNKNSDMILLGICREFIQNSLKHAKPLHITVMIEQNESGLKLTCADDGKGFDVKQLMNHSAGQGLNNIEKRARLLFAETKWESGPSPGTTLTLQIKKNLLVT
jgi:signal transduction histidine kinase